MYKMDGNITIYIIHAQVLRFKFISLGSCIFFISIMSTRIYDFTYVQSYITSPITLFTVCLYASQPSQASDTGQRSF